MLASPIPYVDYFIHLWAPLFQGDNWLLWGSLLLVALIAIPQIIMRRRDQKRHPARYYGRKWYDD